MSNVTVQLPSWGSALPSTLPTQHPALEGQSVTTPMICVYDKLKPADVVRSYQYAGKSFRYAIESGRVPAARGLWMAAQPPLFAYPALVWNLGTIASLTQWQAEEARLLNALSSWRAGAEAAIDTFFDSAEAAPAALYMKAVWANPTGGSSGLTQTEMFVTAFTVATGAHFGVASAVHRQMVAQAIVDVYQQIYVAMRLELTRVLDLLQNEVLEDLIALHPTVSWGHLVHTESALLAALTEFAQLWAPAQVMGRTPFGKIFDLDEVMTTEAYPTPSPQTTTALQSFLATKLTEARQVIDRARDALTGVPEPVINAWDDQLYTSVVDAIGARFIPFAVACGQNGQVIFDDYVSTLSVPTEREEDDDASFESRFRSALMNGRAYNRPVFILCTDACTQAVADKLKELGVNATSLQELGELHRDRVTVSTEAQRTELMLRLYDDFILTLASGGVVFGWPGDTMFGTLAHGARVHGANVLVYVPDSTEVSASAVALYRRLLANPKVSQALRGVAESKFAEIEVARVRTLESRPEIWDSGFLYRFARDLQDMVGWRAWKKEAS